MSYSAFIKSTIALLICLNLPAIHSNGQSIDHWETIIETGQSVKYLVPQGPVPADWTAIAFSDAGWSDGVAGVGYGDGDDNTVVDPCLSVYTRYTFTVDDTAAIERLLLDMDFDDSFVAYLNGKEIARQNLGAPFSQTTWDQPSDGLIEAMLYQGQVPLRYPVADSIIGKMIQGTNVFCVEVHNQGINSSDLSSNAFLHAGINSASVYFNPTPSWFIEPVSYTATLPIMVINTNGQSIPNDPRIVADMGLIYKGEGVENSPEDAFNEYDGKISIEVRGSSSQGFPKKSYTFELQTDSGTNNNVSILGLPPENDFVLNGPYSDKSLIRNVISYKVYEEMGNWAPRTRFINLYLNQDFNGIYILTEKVKQDRNRVNIKPLSAADITSSAISGGYILQIDRTDALASNEYWTSPAVPPYSQFPRNTFEYYDPKIDELTAAQAAYIKNWTNALDLILAGGSYKDPNSGYRKYIDVESFVDYLIFHEFNKDVDAYRLSTFFYKASDLEGGRLHAGPPWDYNLTYGNMDYGGDILETYNWMYPKSAGRYWWPRLMYDPWFENRVFCRWADLKENILNEDHLGNLIDSCTNLMGISVDQNFVRWPVLGQYVWPNSFIGQTYQEEISFLKNWIFDRLDWLGTQWDNQCVATGIDEDIIQPLYSIAISPNPSDLSYTSILVPEAVGSDYMVVIYDLNGRLVHNRSYFKAEGENEIVLENLSYLESGIYLVSLTGENGLHYTGKLVRK